MRKLVVTVALLAVVAGAVPAGGSPSVRRSDFAFAAWMLPTDKEGHFEWYMAVAWQDNSVAGGRGIWSFAGFVRGDCVRKETARRIRTKCESTDFIDGNPKKDFQMATAAEEAELRVRERGTTHFVRWKGAPRPGAYVGEEFCHDGRGLGAGIARPAKARGRLFDRRLGSKHLEYAGLWSGAMASQCSGDRSFDFDFDPATGTARLTISIPR